MKCVNKSCSSYSTLDIDNCSFCIDSDMCNSKISEKSEPVEEVCEWDWDEFGCNLVGCSESSGQCKEDVESFKYCPYCGKPIRVKG